MILAGDVTGVGDVSCLRRSHSRRWLVEFRHIPWVDLNPHAQRGDTSHSLKVQNLRDAPGQGRTSQGRTKRVPADNKKSPTMTDVVPSKYGMALTGSDWVGLPLRIGQVPERGRLEDLIGEVDAILVWTGGPSVVKIAYAHPSQGTAQHEFTRVSGAIDLLPRGTHMHSVEWEGKASLCISVNLPPASLTALSAQPILGLDPARGPQFGLIDSHIADLVRRLHEQAEAHAPWGAVYVQSLSLALASYVSARYGVDAEPAPLRAASLSRAQCLEIERFVDQEISSNFGLVDMAKVVGYSADHFSRLFKQGFNQSPYQFVLSRRIDRAMAMLRDEKLSIAEIASACGFNDQGHLTKVFKQRVGMTPGTFRKG